MGTRKNRSLKNMVLIEKAFRLRQMRRVLLLTLLSVLISTVALAFFYSHWLDLFSGGDLPLYFAPEELADMTRQIPGMQETMVMWLLILGGINAVVTMVASVFMTYTLGGPLYRLKADMQKIGDGDLMTHIQLRDGDEYQDMAESINDSVEQLRRAMQGIQSQVAKLHELHVEGEEKEKLKQAIGNIETELDYFTLPDVEKDGSQKQV